MKPSITEKEFKEACKDCYTPDFYIVLGEASNTPEYLRRYFELLALKQKKAEFSLKLESFKKETLKQLIKEIDDYQNPYPKDIFVWDNKELLDFNRGRFNRHCFEVVENTRTDLKKKVEEIMK